MSEIKG